MSLDSISRENRIDLNNVHAPALLLFFPRILKGFSCRAGLRSDRRPTKFLKICPDVPILGSFVCPRNPANHKWPAQSWARSSESHICQKQADMGHPSFVRGERELTLWENSIGPKIEPRNRAGYLYVPLVLFIRPYTDTRSPKSPV